MSYRSAPTGIERLRSARVAVWGTGLEGREVAKAAIERDADVVLVDDGVEVEGLLSVDGVEVPLRAPGILRELRFDCIVRSPGVSVYRPELEEALAVGCTVTSATAMWLEDFEDRRVIGITGTKGKTTTAWLTMKALEACGLEVRLGGNMGTPLTALYSGDDGGEDRDRAPIDVYVVEVSSFQAADVTASPSVGVLTLLAPDHLDWHGSYDRYVLDKLNLFDHRPGMPIAVSSASADALRMTARYPGRSPYGTDGRVVLRGGSVTVDGAELLDLDQMDLPVRGEHNRFNLCGALTACMILTGDHPTSHALERAIKEMPVLPSRLETVGRFGRIEFVNDALASNPAGTVAALRTFAGRPICLIAGGHDRGVDLTDLLREIDLVRPSPVVVNLPELGERLSAELQNAGSRVRCVGARSVREAVLRATQLLEQSEGEGVVLFSPAAPTPKVEGTYVQRGAAFNDAVRELTGEPQ